MSDPNNAGMNRRSVLKSSLALLAGGAVGPMAAAESEIKNVNTASSPSNLKITDMRYAVIVKPGPSPCALIRIDTNQGVYGLGECRDAGREGTALVLKPHLVGRNPLGIEPILDSIRNFPNHQRMGGGYSVVDLALHDIAGKVYGVPAWRLIGSKYRNRVRIYCHLPGTTAPLDPYGSIYPNHSMRHFAAKLPDRLPRL